jgi:hypothetical protein
MNLLQATNYYTRFEAQDKETKNSKLIFLLTVMYKVIHFNPFGGRVWF